MRAQVERCLGTAGGRDSGVREGLGFPARWWEIPECPAGDAGDFDVFGYAGDANKPLVFIPGIDV